MWPLLVSIPPSNRPFPARKPLNMEALKLQVNLIELRLTLIYLEEVLAHICCSCFYYFIIECIPTKESLDIHCWWPAATLCRIGVFFFFWPAVTALGWGSLFWSGGQSLDPIPKLLPELSLELREPAACIRQVGQCCWWLSKLFRSQWHTLLALWDEFLPGLGLMCHVPALSGSHRRLTGTSRRQRWAWTEGWCPVQGSALPVLHPPISWSNNPSLCYLH